MSPASKSRAQRLVLIGGLAFCLLAVGLLFQRSSPRVSGVKAAAPATPRQAGIPEETVSPSTSKAPRVGAIPPPLTVLATSVAKPTRSVALLSVTGGPTVSNALSPADADVSQWMSLARSMRAAMDAGDSRSALQAARLLAVKTDPNARLEAIEMFRWLGADALPDLTRLLSDPSPRLAEQALDAWQQNLPSAIDHASAARAAVEAVSSLGDHISRQALLMQIAMFPEETAAGYYVAMLDAPDKEVVELALEFLSFLAQEPIGSRADVTRWLARLKQSDVAP